jgi:hypothetical protein
VKKLGAWSANGSSLLTVRSIKLREHDAGSFGSGVVSLTISQHSAVMPRRFPPPWSIEERQVSFIVKDTNGQQIAYLYFEDEPQRQMSTKRLSRDGAAHCG